MSLHDKLVAALNRYATGSRVRDIRADERRHVERDGAAEVRAAGLEERVQRLEDDNVRLWRTLI